MAAQSRLVLELRQTLLALVREVAGVDLDVLGPVGLLQEALGAHAAPILGEGEAGSVAHVSGQRRRMLELFQTVRALMRAVVVARVLRQSGGRFERLRAVPAAVLSDAASRGNDHRRGDQLGARSLHPHG